MSEERPYPLSKLLGLVIEEDLNTVAAGLVNLPVPADFKARVNRIISFYREAVEYLTYQQYLLDARTLDVMDDKVILNADEAAALLNYLDNPLEEAPDDLFSAQAKLEAAAIDTTEDQPLL